jgi:LCP family protein required for cell wall assembly
MVLGVAVVAALASARVGLAYWSIERDEFDPESARGRLEAMTEEETAEAQDDLVELEEELIEDDPVALPSPAPPEGDSQELEAVEEDPLFPFMHSPTLPDEMFTSFLLVGSDLSGALADAIILALLPEDGSAPILASLPRDLYLPSLCTDSYARINSALGGCRGLATGPELLSLTVEDFTGVAIDHFAQVSFSGFRRVIDTLGGVEICVDNPTRDSKSDLYLSSGCTEANGALTLAWVRSRHTQELVGGTWRSIGASDFSRQNHQQEVLIQLLGKMKAYGSLAALGEIADELADHVRLDETFSIGDAVSLAWSYRDLDPSDLSRIGLAFENYRTPAGAAVLLPTISFTDALAAAYPPIAG